jgi:2-amino-4-hydroxy-6-hydroxymethyldihydropteridine diphosphokinase
MNTIYLSLGSNLGDREQNILKAIQALGPAGMRVIQLSSIFETEPVEFLGQPWFLNCVVRAETDLDPQELMNQLLGIERAMGRERREPKGPRIVDIDILLYGMSIVRMPKLQIPHPRMAERRFVLVPFAEIAPEEMHPGLNKTIAELLRETADLSQVRKLNP